MSGIAGVWALATFAFLLIVAIVLTLNDNGDGPR